MNSIENQLVQGVRDWQIALLPGSSLGVEQQAFLQRLLLLLAHVGLLVFDEGYHYTKHSSLPLVAYLNHGASIKIELSKDLLYPLLGYLVAVEAKQANPLAATSYLKPWTNKTSHFTSQTRAMAIEHFCFNFNLGTSPVQLILTISKMLAGQAALSLRLTGYELALQFPDHTKDRTPTHPFWQYQAQVVSLGKQLYVPTGVFAIKATLTAEEFGHIKELGFNPQLIDKPPSEHDAKALAIHYLVNLFSRLKQQNLSIELQQFLHDSVYPQYQAYLNIESANYQARRNFLQAWLGRKPYVHSWEIIKLHADLTARAIVELSDAEQQKLLSVMVEPLLQACSRELMALSRCD